jgi:hypothetical protein
MPTASSNVRFQGQLGKHLLALSFSQLDPKLTSAANADRRAIEAASYDACLPNIRIPRKVLKGGSHLCAQVVGTARFAVAHP